MCWTDFWIESFEFESRSVHSILNSTWAACASFVCCPERERESTWRQLYQEELEIGSRSSGSASIEATFQKWNCICSAWETIITLAHPPGPVQSLARPQFIQLWKYFMCANKNISFIEFRVDFRPLLGLCRLWRTQNFCPSKWQPRGSSGQSHIRFCCRLYRCEWLPQLMRVAALLTVRHKRRRQSWNWKRHWEQVVQVAQVTQVEPV